MNTPVQQPAFPSPGNRGEPPTGEEEIEFKISGWDENGDFIVFGTSAASHDTALLAYRCFHFPAPGKQRKATTIHEECDARSKRWNLMVEGGGVTRYYEVR